MRPCHCALGMSSAIARFRSLLPSISYVQTVEGSCAAFLFAFLLRSTDRQTRGRARARACVYTKAHKGGADIAALTVNLIKHRHPDWAIYLNDLTNGFNTVTRKAISRGLSAAGLDHLSPAVDLWYRKSSRLYLAGKSLTRPSSEELTATGAKATSRPLTAAAGAEVRTSTGCQQRRARPGALCPRHPPPPYLH